MNTIVNKANLNHEIATSYIKQLSQNELVEIDQGIYRTTSKGIDALKGIKGIWSELADQGVLEFLKFGHS